MKHLVSFASALSAATCGLEKTQTRATEASVPVTARHFRCDG